MVKVIWTKSKRTATFFWEVIPKSCKYPFESRYLTPELDPIPCSRFILEFGRVINDVEVNIVVLIFSFDIVFVKVFTGRRIFFPTTTFEDPNIVGQVDSLPETSQAARHLLVAKNCTGI